MRAVVQKWLSPAGFVLALLLFLLLPTVGVSCSAPDGEVSVTATGAELVARATPRLDATGAAAAVSAGLGFWLSLLALLTAGAAAIPALRRKRTAD